MVNQFLVINNNQYKISDLCNLKNKKLIQKYHKLKIECKEHKIYYKPIKMIQIVMMKQIVK